MRLFLVNYFCLLLLGAGCFKKPSDKPLKEKPKTELLTPIYFPEKQEDPVVPPRVEIQEPRLEPEPTLPESVSTPKVEREEPSEPEKDAEESTPLPEVKVPEPEPDFTFTPKETIQNSEDKEFIQRFNTVVRDVANFPPKGKSLEKYFYIFKNVADLKDAELFFFGEDHTVFASRVWNAGAMNDLLGEEDKDSKVILFEGAQGGLELVRGAQIEILLQIFSGREYELTKSHKEYDPGAIYKIFVKYVSILKRLRNKLLLNVLNLKDVRGFFWDLIDPQTGNLHNDSEKRNEMMVATIEQKISEKKQVFVITGAMHLPPWEFAFQMANLQQYPTVLNGYLSKPGVIEGVLNDEFYTYFYNQKLLKTKPIWDFIKNKKYAILIPKNIPLYMYIEKYLPKNTQN